MAPSSGLVLLCLALAVVRSPGLNSRVFCVARVLAASHILPSYHSDHDSADSAVHAQAGSAAVLSPLLFALDISPA
ncbi:hypothetical protein NUW54_g6024 [Trametes sanguinea]|uniref:Uncharacterized protein n=1 Tax=Trametes sanguinea TaxID=158606 RepID=A0ACC1PW49_9APHY|nr:hypothetical protein NUW54_g6024 [Trametes sanguinea]